jgi:hypothetical protein
MEENLISNWKRMFEYIHPGYEAIYFEGFRDFQYKVSRPFWIIFQKNVVLFIIPYKSMQWEQASAELQHSMWDIPIGQPTPTHCIFYKDDAHRIILFR